MPEILSKQTKKLVLQGLQYLRGDNLERAKMAFRGLNPQQMQEQHGESGKTRQQLLDEYQRHEDEVTTAIWEVRGL